jgi:hypothetical protein
VAALVLLICAALPASTLAKQGLSQLNFGRPTLTMSQVQSLANQDSLPPEIEGGWQRRGFQLVQRNPRSRQGEFSLIWRYSLDDQQFDASVDLPFVGWHEPATQLQLQGWKIDQPKIQWEDDWPWAETKLENDLGGRAVIFHALLTSSGEPYRNVPADLLDEQSLSPEQDESQASALAATQLASTTITYQFQLFSETGEELADDDLRLLREQFLQLRKIALKLAQ